MAFANQPIGLSLRCRRPVFATRNILRHKQIPVIYVWWTFKIDGFYAFAVWAMSTRCWLPAKCLDPLWRSCTFDWCDPAIFMTKPPHKIVMNIYYMASKGERFCEKIHDQNRWYSNIPFHSSIIVVCDRLSTYTPETQSSILQSNYTFRRVEHWTAMNGVWKLDQNQSIHQIGFLLNDRNVRSDGTEPCYHNS